METKEDFGVLGCFIFCSHLCKAAVICVSINFILGCATSLQREAQQSQNIDPVFMYDLDGVVKFENNGYFKGEHDYNGVKSPEKIIEHEFKRSGKIITNNDKNIYTFKYNKCEIVELHPTSNEFLNILIRFATLTMVPTGKIIKCKVNLTVSDDKNNLKTYETQIKLRDFVTVGYGHFAYIKNEESMAYPARLLLQMHEKSMIENKQ